jgi:hypothetical protein
MYQIGLQLLATKSCDTAALAASYRVLDVSPQVTSNGWRFGWLGTRPME